jgi:alpha-tubulin suppressor-like RCC1 family protein
MGQLGDDSTAQSYLPVEVIDLSSGVSAVSAGWNHTCALTATGGLKCWGDNTGGQLGHDVPMESHVPVDVAGLSSGVQAISAGEGHTCALTTGGGVECWGFNDDGRLGDGSTTNSAIPVAVTGLSSGVQAIAMGGFHSCALTAEGAVRCWGSNGNGQLGDGSKIESHVPVDVTGLTSAIQAISAGEYQTCALTTAGAVLCWGGNEFGALGNNDLGDSAVPVAVSGLASGVEAIATGFHHTCAVTHGGAAKCWGLNADGQLGDDSTVESLVPVDVAGLASSARAISAGEYHTCALTTPGSVECWGNGSFDQLGTNSTHGSLVPVDVTGL